MPNPLLGSRLCVRSTGEPVEFVGYWQTRLRCRNKAGEVKAYRRDEVQRKGRPRLYSAEQMKERRRVLARERYARKQGL